jgi:hypothetical protein
MAIRIGNWKAAFMEQHAEVDPNTPIGVWQGPFTKLRGAEPVQPAVRPLRAQRRLDLQGRLAGEAIVPARPRPGRRGAVALQLQGIPAAPETGELQSR